MMKIANLLMVIVACLPIAGDAGAQALPDYDLIIKNQENYITSLQQASGAIHMTTEPDDDGYKIEPYFSNLSCMALLEADKVTFSPIVKQWLLWYFKHLNSDGTIYDWYTLNTDGSGGEKNIKGSDSEDSYGATFISLCEQFAAISNSNKAWLSTYTDSITKIEQMLDRLIDRATGLTHAKHDYDTEYLEDNSEVNFGMKRIVRLISFNIGDINNVQKWRSNLQKNTVGIAALWYPGNNRYDIFYGSHDFKPGILYPDGSCDLYPALYEIQNAKSNMPKFDLDFPAWPTGAVIDTGGFHLAVIVLAAAKSGERSNVNTYLTWVQNNIKAGRQPVPWNVMEAGSIIRAALLVRFKK